MFPLIRLDCGAELIPMRMHIKIHFIWIDTTGTDVITANVEFGISKDVADFFGIEDRGIDIGAGISFPGITGDEFDIGVVGTVHGGGGDIGIARIRGSLNFD